MDAQSNQDLSWAVQQYLEELTARDRSAPLHAQYLHCEFWIRNWVRFVAFADIKLFARKHHKAFEDYDPRLLFGNSIYEATIGSHPKNSDVLSMSIMCTDRSNSKILPSPLIARFESIGKYKEIHLYIEEIFESRSEQILEAAQTVLESGYNWLLQFVRKSLHSVNDKAAAEEVYGVIRRALPEKVANSVWPYAIIDGDGIYTVDAIALEKALANLKKRTLKTSLSPLEMLILFTSTRLPREQTFTNVALGRNATIRREFVKAKYAHSSLQLVEQSIYLSNDHAIQPIIREGKTQLAVAYPTSLSREIKPVLDRRKDEIGKIITVQGEALRRTVDRLRECQPSSANTFAKAGAFFGSFSGEFLKHLIEHCFQLE